MMKPETVPTAGSNSLLTNTARQSAVQELAPIDLTHDCLSFAKVKAIRHVGKQDVYNMEVKDHHNFSVNGGLVVHNSIDAIRYALEDDMKGSRKAKAVQSLY